MADQVLREIRRIVRRVSEHSKFLSRESGLTVPQLLCMKVIGDFDGEETTITTVARNVQLSPATVSRIIDRLEVAGLVLRERAAEDRRKVHLLLTPRGYERYQTLPAPLQEEFVARLHDLSEQERERLLGALRQVNELMDARELDAAPLLAPGSSMKEAGDPEPF